MKPVQKLKIFSLLMAMPFVTNADLDCPSGRLFDVSGSSTHTLSLSAGFQTGVMQLELRNEASNVEYKFNCGLIGEVVETIQLAEAPFPWPTKLDHTVNCTEGSFKTRGDAVTSTPYSFGSITEVISTIKEGEGLFENMRADITATGTVNLLTGKNDFELDGQVCLKKEKKEKKK